MLHWHHGFHASDGIQRTLQMYKWFAFDSENITTAPPKTHHIYILKYNYCVRFVCICTLCMSTFLHDLIKKIRKRKEKKNHVAKKPDVSVTIR